MRSVESNVDVGFADPRRLSSRQRRNEACLKILLFTELPRFIPDDSLVRFLYSSQIDNETWGAFSWYRHEAIIQEASVGVDNSPRHRFFDTIF